MNLTPSRDLEPLRQPGLACARGIADWWCLTQSPHRDDNSSAGRLPFMIEIEGHGHDGIQWNSAFGLMGLLAAARAFDEPRYAAAALRAGRYLKTLQIFDPFLPEHYGAIREMAPQTPWCYTRDALSAAWGFIELYRYTGEAEYLERARLWGEWFLLRGLDPEGWPISGVQFEPWFEQSYASSQMLEHVQGSFQGGCLNFLYHLSQETGDKKWVGPVFTGIADHFIRYIQQPSGHFATIDRVTKLPPSADPQAGLHRVNDDLGTLGLLCAYRVTGDRRYLDSIERFLNAVLSAQRADGFFEDSVASIPVVLNILHEVGDLVSVPALAPDAVARALRALYSRQSDGNVNPLMRGGMVETLAPSVCARSSGYSLIFLLKLFAGIPDYLTACPVKLTPHQSVAKES